MAALNTSAAPIECYDHETIIDRPKQRAARCSQIYMDDRLSALGGYSCPFREKKNLYIFVSCEAPDRFESKRNKKETRKADMALIASDMQHTVDTHQAMQKLRLFFRSCRFSKVSSVGSEVSVDQ
jgi:hypothetical protein